MMKIFIAPILILAFVNIINAQCDQCDIKGNQADYCHINESFPDYCAQFTLEGDKVCIKIGKKTKKIPTLENPKLEDFLAIAKSEDFTGVDVLFLQDAFKAWAYEKDNIGYEFTESGLGIKIIKEGNGDLVKKGQRVVVHYTGSLAKDGTKFDSSRDRGEPFSFILGTGGVIMGWEEGIAQLKIGSKAFLKIPPHLGYGTRGAGRLIPPNSTLIFEIEVMGVR